MQEFIEALNAVSWPAAIALSSVAICATIALCTIIAAIWR